MAYMLHLERDEPFDEEAWRAAVRAEPGLRLREVSFAVIRNPRTGEVIRIAASPLDAIGELLSFEFGPRISFPGRAFESESEAKCLVFRVATLMGARVVGDEGEVYLESASGA